MRAAACSCSPGISAVVDIGALNGRAIYVDERGKVLAYKMTSQCASGSGQFLENIARYLGVAIEEIGPLSCSSKDPEKVQLDLRRAGRDRRHQHGQPRHRHARHPEGHPPVDGVAHRQAAQGDRHQVRARRCSPAGWRWTSACWRRSARRWSTRRLMSRPRQPPGFDLRRRHRRGACGARSATNGCRSSQDTAAAA